MNMPVKKAYTVFLSLLLLCSNCAQERQPVTARKEVFTPYTLELITMLVPSSWQKKDYESNSENVEEPYIFMAPKPPQDSLLGDAIMVIIKRKEGKPDLGRLRQGFVESMQVDGQNQVKMLSFQDSTFVDGELALVEYDNTIPAQKLDQICTYGSYYRKGISITVIGVARRGSAQDNSEKRRLFRKVIHSVKWING